MTRQARTYSDRMRAVDHLPGPPSTAVRYLAVGPERHGVTRLALQLGRLSAHESRWVQDLSRLPADPAGVTHLHVTDHLLGDSPAGAARRFAALAAQGPCTVTLHDLPQPSDGDGRFERRADGYRAIVQRPRVSWSRASTSATCCTAAGSGRPGWRSSPCR